MFGSLLPAARGSGPGLSVSGLIKQFRNEYGVNCIDSDTTDLGKPDSPIVEHTEEEMEKAMRILLNSFEGNS